MADGSDRIRRRRRKTRTTDHTSTHEPLNPLDWVDIGKIAQHRGVSIATINRKVKQGLPCSVSGTGTQRKHRRFQPAAVDKWWEVNAADDDTERRQVWRPPRATATSLDLLAMLTREELLKMPLAAREQLLKRVERGLGKAKAAAWRAFAAADSSALR